jgi:hypothetical protein
VKSLVRPHILEESDLQCTLSLHLKRSVPVAFFQTPLDDLERGFEERTGDSEEGLRDKAKLSEEALAFPVGRAGDRRRKGEE